MAYLRPLPSWDGDKIRLSRGCIALLVFGILFTYNLLFRLRRWYRLRKVPGPLLCGFTSLPLSYYHWRGDVAVWFKTLTDKYGARILLTHKPTYTFSV